MIKNKIIKKLLKIINIKAKINKKKLKKFHFKISNYR